MIVTISIDVKTPKDKWSILKVEYSKEKDPPSPLFPFTVALDGVSIYSLSEDAMRELCQKVLKIIE